MVCFFLFIFIAVKGRSRSSAPRLPPINADRMRTAKALVEKAVKVIMRRIFYPSAVRSDSLYPSALAEESLHGGRTLSCDTRRVEGQRLGGTSFIVHGTESPSLPW